MFSMINKLRLVILLLLISVPLSIISVQKQTWIYFVNSLGTTQIGLEDACLGTYCEKFRTTDLNHVNSYIFINIYISSLLQVISIIAIIVGLKVEHLPNICAQWTVIVRVGLCCSLSCLGFASFIFLVGLKISKNHYGGILDCSGLIFTLDKTQLFRLYPGECFYFLTSATVLNTICLVTVISIDMF